MGGDPDGGQCEWAEYPSKVLEKHWPEVPRWKDIRTLTGDSFYERTGTRTVDIISGGFPCQPFSVAGKRRGREDDRYLWPEMVRVIKELRPAWVVGENVAGIVKMALPDILSELEACGYRTRAFLIPACAVGARHRRYRVAIVAHAGHNVLPGRERAEESRKGEALREPASCSNDVQYTDCPGCSEQYASEKPGKKGFPGGGCDERDVRHTAGEGLEDRAGRQMEGYKAPEQEPERSGDDVSSADNGSRPVRRDGEFSTAEETGRSREDNRGREEKHEPGKRGPAQSGLGRMADGLPGWVDGYWDTEPDIPRIAKGIPHRVERLKALGNAVVPQQFYPIFEAIVEVDRR